MSDSEKALSAAIREAEQWAILLYWSEGYESDIRGFEIPADKWRAVVRALEALEAQREVE